MIFLLIYTHIAALSLGVFIVDIIATRKNLIVDIAAVLMVSVLWPYTLFLLIQHEVKKP